MKSGMKSGKPVPTLSDVAQRAGVSTATVSRCLNTPDRVIEETRNRVMEVVNEMGYTPNFAARVMAAKHTHTIGAIIPTMENAIFARGLQAFQETLRERGYTLLVASSSYSPDVEEEQVRTLVSRGADGVLLIGHDRNDRVERFLEAQNTPSLVAWTYDPDASAPSIGFDNRRAMQALAEEVLALGHRRLGMISAHRAENDRARHRFEGVQAAMRAGGLDSKDLRIVETEYGVDHGAAAFRDLMQGPERPSVVMCGNDVLAVGAMRQARDMGLEVPRDVSVTGFDDIELARIVTPALTTVHVPHREMGRKAALALIDMVENQTVAATEELQTELCLRASLAAPAKV